MPSKKKLRKKIKRLEKVSIRFEIENVAYQVMIEDLEQQVKNARSSFDYERKTWGRFANWIADNFEEGAALAGRISNGDKDVVGILK